MKKNKSDFENLKKALENCDEKDFDGHTDFELLTPTQKLEWLSQLIYFKYIAFQRNRK